MSVEETEIELKVLVSDAQLFMTVEIPLGASREAIERCLFEIESALASVEKVRDKDLTGLIWEQRRSKRGSTTLVANRRFSDPTYPFQFDTEFRRVHAMRASGAMH